MAPPDPPISRGFMSHSIPQVLYFPGERSVSQIDHFGHLDYLVPGNRKKHFIKIHMIA